jgi:hypothetical protein
MCGTNRPDKHQMDVPQDSVIRHSQQAIRPGLGSSFPDEFVHE